MAKGAFYLRPSEDISVEHNKYPADSNAAYLLINEEVADGESTYISISADTSTGDVDVCSTFKMSGALPTKISDLYCASITLRINAVISTSNIQYDSSPECVILVNGAEIETIALDESDASYAEGCYCLGSSSVDYINNYIKNHGAFPEIRCTLHDKFSNITTGGNDLKSTRLDKKWTQVYIVINYLDDITAFLKRSNAWKRCTAPYKKQNGVWSRIGDAEAKDILKNRVINSTLSFNNLAKNASFEDLSIWAQSSYSSPVLSSTFTSIDAQSKYGSQSAKFYVAYTTSESENAAPSEACLCISQKVATIANHNYYCSAWLKASEESSNTLYSAFDGKMVWNATVYTDWTKFSGIITATNNSRSASLLFSMDDTSNGAVTAWLDGVILIDLTDSFGEGNEPTKEWCDENIPFFEGQWGMKAK